MKLRVEPAVGCRPRHADLVPFRLAFPVLAHGVGNVGGLPRCGSHAFLPPFSVDMARVGPAPLVAMQPNGCSQPRSRSNARAAQPFILTLAFQSGEVALA